MTISEPEATTGSEIGQTVRSGGVNPDLGARRGHPEMRLVGLLLVVLATLTGIRWTGVVWPQTDLRSSSMSGSVDEATGWSFAAVEVHNNGLLPVKIRNLEVVQSRPATDVSFYLRDPGPVREGRAYPAVPAALETITDLRPLTPFELGRGENREVVMMFRIACSTDWPTGVDMEVRTALGLDRTVRNHDLSSGSFGATPC